MTIEETLTFWTSNQKDYFDICKIEGTAERYHRLIELARRWKDCFEALMTHAESGNSEIWRALGNAYSTGRGPSINREESNRWYRRAAEAGHPKAMSELGSQLQRSDDLNQKRESVEWLLKAASLGDASGMVWLGFAYRQGDGVEVDFEESAEWFIKAVGAGDGHAMIHAARIYFCYSYQPEKAREWLLKAADAGYVESYNMLAQLHDNRGTPEYDPVEAVKWWQVGVTAGKGSGARAALELSMHYRSGAGVPCDQSLALEWARKAVSLASEKTAIYRESVKFLQKIERDFL